MLRLSAPEGKRGPADKGESRNETQPSLTAAQEKRSEAISASCAACRMLLTHKHGPLPTPRHSPLWELYREFSAMENSLLELSSLSFPAASSSWLLCKERVKAEPWLPRCCYPTHLYPKGTQQTSQPGYPIHPCPNLPHSPVTPSIACMDPSPIPYLSHPSIP